MIVEDDDGEVCVLVAYDFRVDKPVLFQTGKKIWIQNPVQRVAKDGRCVIRLDIVNEASVGLM